MKARFLCSGVAVMGLMAASASAVTVTNSFHQGSSINDSLLLPGTNLILGIHGNEVSNFNGSGVGAAHNTINISNPDFAVAGTGIYGSQSYNPNPPHFFYVNGDFKTINLTNGTLGQTSSINAFAPGNPTYIDYSVTVNLGSNPLGYDITDIAVFAGEKTGGGPDRYYIRYNIEYSLVGSSTFQALSGASADYEPTVPFTETVTRSVVSGITLSGVDAIRFNIINPGSQFATYYREFQVIGSPTIPEPASLTLMGLATLGLIRRRRAGRAD